MFSAWASAGPWMEPLRPVASILQAAESQWKMKVIRSLDHKLRLYEPTYAMDDDNDDNDDNNNEDRQAGIVAKVGVRSIGNKKRKTIRPPTRNNKSNKDKDMSADKSFDQWRRDQLMTCIVASDVTVTANPTEADSDIAPQKSSSRARTPNATVTANPLAADSGIEGTAPCASPGAVIAGPRVSDKTTTTTTTEMRLRTTTTAKQNNMSNIVSRTSCDEGTSAAPSSTFLMTKGVCGFCR